MIHPRARQLLIGSVNLLAASFIAGAIVYTILGQHHGENRKCSDKPCYIALDKRLVVAEAVLNTRIESKTRDRYTGQDAERDKRAMIAYVDRSEERSQKNMQALRLELNRRFEELHGSGMGQQ